MDFITRFHNALDKSSIFSRLHERTSNGHLVLTYSSKFPHDFDQFYYFNILVSPTRPECWCVVLRSGRVLMYSKVVPLENILDFRIDNQLKDFIIYNIGHFRGDFISGKDFNYNYDGWLL